jgi:uncharacterized protein (TIRG00374 family)
LIIFPLIIIIVFLIMGLTIYLTKNSKFLYFIYIKSFMKDFNRNLLYLIIMSSMFVLLGAFSFWIYFFMFGYNINFLILISIYSIIQIINMIPISINSLGLKEGSMIYFFSLLNIPPEITLSIALISRFVMMIQTSIGGLIYLKTN